jgi:phosphoglycolate phosphatase
MPQPLRGTVLLDLDGTISDPSSGLFSAFRHAVASVGHPLPADRSLNWIIGPPLRESFAEVLPDAALGVQALEHYRAHYAAGAMYDNVVYPGIPEAIAALGGAGFRLCVATSKLDQFAVLIMRNFGLAERFSGIYGSSHDGTRDQKADVIAHCLATEGIDPATCIMVGDRKHDVLGAAIHGLPCIGVTWGYGDVAELKLAGARAICETPSALPAAVEAIVRDFKPVLPA